jgi:hypothetical protein
VWYRAVQTRHLTGKALSTAHTRTISSRFSAGSILPTNLQFEILYLAENHHVALYEVQALLGNPFVTGGPFPHPSLTWTILPVNIRLNDVFDLTKVSEQSVLQTSAQELTGDWQGYQHRLSGKSVKSPTGRAPTQELGEELYHQAKIEGFLTISAKVPDQMVLIIFPERVRKNSHRGSFVTFYNPITLKPESVVAEEEDT